MNIRHFSSLNLQQKSDLIWEWGYLTARRTEGNHNIVLFLLGDFYAEVYIERTSHVTEKIQEVNLSDLHPDYLKNLSPDHPFYKLLLQKAEMAQLGKK